MKDREKVVAIFLERHLKLKPRHQRDIERIFSLIQALALLNLFNRERDDKDNVYANEEDIENAFKLFDKISESQELGIPPYIHNFFNEIIKPLFIEANNHLFEQDKEQKAEPSGLFMKEIMRRHFEVYGRMLPEWQLRREILPALEDAGLIYMEPDPNDKRRNLIFCTTSPFKIIN